ncbi:MAG TPA: hypothetical protein VEC19_02055 [Usitatibacter sp.]|nr:hypothetical protein [Usitatibacter sp.]
MAASQPDFQPPLTAEAQQYLVEACDEMEALQGLLNRHWRFQSTQGVSFDQATSSLVFTYADERRVEAPAELLGMYRRRDRTWNWAWARPETAQFAPGGAMVRALGERFGLDYLLTPAYRLPDASFLGLLTAVGVKATQAIGHYIGVHESADGETEIVYLVKRAKGKAAP